MTTTATEGAKLAAYDRVAVALMETRPDLPQMSLDEWLDEHHDKLTREERAAARAIIDLHHAAN